MIISAMLWILAQRMDPVTASLERRNRESEMLEYQREQERIQSETLSQIQEQTRLMQEAAEREEKYRRNLESQRVFDEWNAEQREFERRWLPR